MQVMSAITAELASQVYGEQLDFELLYTPMDTGEFTWTNSVSSGPTQLIGIVFVMIQLCAPCMVKISQEDPEREQRLQWMLKISGMREVAVIMREIVVNMSTTVIYGSLCTYLLYSSLYHMGTTFGIFYVIIIFFFINMLLADLILTYALVNYPRA
jgi:hypothetical protein